MKNINLYLFYISYFTWFLSNLDLCDIQIR